MDVLDDLHVALEGRYEIVREIGRGGMAVVYLARDLKHGREVAIKVLPSELATPGGSERFLREIRTAAQLAHPNILPLHDSIALDGVLCYVMPYVEGESLRQRLERERQLGVDTAVDIARQVAAGLDYAHVHGIVHRDIKPENILLMGDQAVIADFGLARALFTASSSPVTVTGLAVGTPAYMSPEQAAGDKLIDGRADEYSLACTFFEMVAGIPPFRAATAGALLAAHATRTPPSLCQERESCPPHMDLAVQRALAKVPADRFGTAGDFVRALDPRRGTTPVISHRGIPYLPRSWRSWTVVLPAALMIGVAGPRVVERVRYGNAPIDSSRVLVLPFRVEATGALAPERAHRELCGAIRRWRDLSVNGCGPADEKVRVPSLRVARGMARRAGAASLVLASLRSARDSVEIKAVLYREGREPREGTLRVPKDQRLDDARGRELTAILFRTTEVPDDADDGSTGTDFLQAWEAYSRAQAARARWALDEAERELRTAVRIDPRFAQAQLWLAQVLFWQHFDDPREAGNVVERALALRGRLSPRDTLLARGVESLAKGRHASACVAYRALHEAMPQSELPWFGMGACLGLDPLVVPDRRSPSGWRFRSSTHSAIAALDSAIARAEGAPAFAFRMQSKLLTTEPAKMRGGRAAAPDTSRFYARASWDADSVVYIPYQASSFAQAKDPTDRRTLSTALERNRQRLLDSYTEWVRRAPRSADARAALASVEELLGATAAEEGGAPLAFATLTDAGKLSDDPYQQLELAAMQVRLLAKHSRFADARRLADSLLKAVPRANERQAAVLAGIAALVGDIGRTSELLRVVVRADAGSVFHSRVATPAPVADAAAAFLAAASLGQCDDQLRAYPGRMRQVVEQYVPDDQRAEMFSAVAVRALTLAVPCLGVEAVVGVRGPNLLLRMQQSLAARDVKGLTDQIADRAARVGDRPGDVSLDHAFQEAWLLVRIGRAEEAGRGLDLPLTALSTVSTRMLDVDHVPAAAALGRAMALGAQLAIARGDTALATCYAHGVLALWKGSSPPLQPVLSEMQRIASTTKARTGPRCVQSETVPTAPAIGAR